MWRFTPFVFMCIIGHCACASLNMTEYLSMPKMYEFEDYDRCLFAHPPEQKRTYCYVRALIKPNQSSDIWKTIEKYSSDHKRFYRHDRIDRGICMDDCKTKMLYYDYETRMKYYVPKFKNDTEVTTDPNLYSNALHNRVKYHKFASMCVNFALKKQYSLSAQTDILFCETNFDDERPVVDETDVVFVVLCVVILTLVFMSTAYDFYLKRQNLPHLCNREHYMRPMYDSLEATLVSFSLPRNWYRLTNDSSAQSELSRDLRPINAIRVICMFGVIMAHSAVSVSLLPTENPQYLEMKYLSAISMILINGSVILQVYFAITGYLVSTQFTDMKEKTKFSIAYFWKAIIYRYLRFTPMYAFLLFFHATWLTRLSSGPMWPLFSDLERNICRKNYWTNLLYVNNVFYSTEPCFQHAWYLAADFQLMIVGVFIQLLIWRFPKFTKSILAVCVLFSFVVPAYVTYVNKFEGIFMATPEKTRYAYWYDDMYHKAYIPFYMNFGSFLFGMIGGVIYSEHKKGTIDLSQSKLLSIIWWLMIPFSFVMIYSGFIFYKYDLEKPAIWIGLYAALSKNFWGFFGAIFITGIAMNKGWVIKDIFRQPMFRTMGRLTFGAYLVHLDVIRASYGFTRQPIYGAEMEIIEALVASYFISYVLSFVLNMMIEMPFYTLQKQIFAFKGKAPSTEEKISDAEATKLAKNLTDNFELKNKITI